MTKEEALCKWEKEYGEFLEGLGIASLRSLGRFSGVPQATTRKKAELTQWILDIATGKTTPAEKSRRGAPVKEDFVDPTILSRLEELNFSRAVIESEYAENADAFVGDIFPVSPAKAGDLVLCASEKGKEAYFDRTVYVGTLKMLGGAYCVTVVEPREIFGKKAVIAQRKVGEIGARIGDDITFHAQAYPNFLIVTEVLSVNAVVPHAATDFERAEVEYPCEKLLPSCYSLESASSRNGLLKYFTALYPVAKGQRVLLSGAPKSGKSTLLKSVLAALSERGGIQSVVCLCERPPEEIGEWQRTFPSTEIYASGYGDEAERHVSQVERALESAKAHVCDGKNAVLFIDDMNALARAYNETDASSGGRVLDDGLESKTVHFIKKVFGSARKLKSGASLTVFSVFSTDTGAAFDSVLFRELRTAASAIWQLSGNFRRGQSALPDGELSRIGGEEAFLSEKEMQVLHELFSLGAERMYEGGKESVLESVNTSEDLLQAYRYAVLKDF